MAGGSSGTEIPQDAQVKNVHQVARRRTMSPQVYAFTGTSVTAVARPAAQQSGPRVC